LRADPLSNGEAMRIPALVSISALAVLGCVGLGLAADGSGWYLAKPSDLFAVGTGETPGMSGQRAVYIRGSANPGSFRVGTLQQDLALDTWRGKRVRVSLRYKQEAPPRTTAYGDIWAQVGKANGTALRAGSFHVSASEWRLQQFVMDVPESAVSLALGVDLHGTGTGWVDGVSIEPVGVDVPVTPGKEYVSVAIGDRRGYVEKIAQYFGASGPGPKFETGLLPKTQ
jgi:hypothetical protein